MVVVEEEEFIVSMFLGRMILDGENRLERARVRRAKNVETVRRVSLCLFLSLSPWRHFNKN
jgi:hypothetical protein